MTTRWSKQNGRAPVGQGKSICGRGEKADEEEEDPVSSLPKDSWQAAIRRLMFTGRKSPDDSPQHGDARHTSRDRVWKEIGGK